MFIREVISVDPTVLESPHMSFLDIAVPMLIMISDFSRYILKYAYRTKIRLSPNSVLTIDHTTDN